MQEEQNRTIIEYRYYECKRKDGKYMEFISAVLSEGVQYIFMLAVALGAVLLGIKVRNAKDKKA